MSDLDPPLLTDEQAARMLKLLSMHYGKPVGTVDQLTDYFYEGQWAWAMTTRPRRLRAWRIIRSLWVVMCLISASAFVLSFIVWTPVSSFSFGVMLAVGLMGFASATIETRM